MQNKKKTANQDIIQLLKHDHEPIKKLFEILKKPEASLNKKRSAFEKFSVILPQHAKAEGESLYVFMKDTKELRQEGLEGDTEHALADQLIEEINHAVDDDEWMAKVKVLAELVEHHVKEEEKEVFKKVKSKFNLDTRVQMGEEYTRLWKELDIQRGSQAPVRNSYENRPSQAY